MRVLVLAALAAACPALAAGPALAGPSPAGGDGPPPRHVVLVIGDGMGLAQITAAHLATGDDLFLASAPAVGLQVTGSTVAVTDSAAAATALACGVKTHNGQVGQTPDGAPCATLLEEAAAAGRGTGVVVTSRLTHATPAAFLAHHPDRREERVIARQLLDAPVDLLVGGGRDMFPESPRETRVWRRRGVTVLDGREAILAHRALPLVGFTHPGLPPPVAERGPTAPLAAHAFQLLRDHGEGALLLVEGSQVDWGGHAHDPAWVVDEVLDLDATVRALVALGGDDTLVVVTADHETGGLSLVARDDGFDAAFSTPGHTAAMVPVFAWGPGAQAFTGVYDNTALHGRLRAALGLE